MVSQLLTGIFTTHGRQVVCYFENQTEIEAPLTSFNQVNTKKWNLRNSEIDQLVNILKFEWFCILKSMHRMQWCRILRFRERWVDQNKLLACCLPWSTRFFIRNTRRKLRSESLAISITTIVDLLPYLVIGSVLKYQKTIWDKHFCQSPAQKLILNIFWEG